MSKAGKITAAISGGFLVDCRGESFNMQLLILGNRLKPTINQKVSLLVGSSVLYPWRLTLAGVATGNTTGLANMDPYPYVHATSNSFLASYPYSRLQCIGAGFAKWLKRLAPAAC